jgi:hypothetical protein
MIASVYKRKWTRALCVEVLVNALADLQRNKYRRPALAWIKSNKQHIGSFC